ncbi:MAG: 2OG-Fe(II) oxygenase family protein [Planctomycetota bacterium]
MTLLGPGLRDRERLAAARAAWAREPSLRVEDALDPDFAAEALAALRTQPHQVVISHDPRFAFQYWQAQWVPEQDCDHVLCRLGRALDGELREQVAALTGLTLASPADRRVTAAAYLKGGYLDAHDDFGHGRSVAFVLGLTESSWPAESGGWLELLNGADGPARERRAPGWNTLDLFEVETPGRFHRVPILREHQERRTVYGWFYA